MAHSSTRLLTHVIFSTKGRSPSIETEIRSELHAYLGGIVRELGGTALAIKGTADHVHVLLRLPPDVSMAEALRVMKANSSRWVHQRWPRRRAFAWQAGYGAFSVSESNVPAIVKYISNQEAHHRKISYQEEFLQFLKRHSIAYDERYLWR